MTPKIPVWLDERLSSKKRLIDSILKRELKEYCKRLKSGSEWGYNIKNNLDDTLPYIPIITHFEIDEEGIILYS